MFIFKYNSKEDTPSDDLSPSQVVLNRPLDISLNVEKTLTFNHNDLNNQTTLKYSGYLPVTFRYQRPRFLRAWYDEQESLNNGTYTHSNLPINKNGKYKVIPNNSENPEGYILARPIDQTGNDYDVQIDIPSNSTDLPDNAIIVKLTNADVNVAKDDPDAEGYIKIPGNFWDHVIQDVENRNQEFFNSLYINVNEINLPRDNSITLRLRNQDIIDANSEHNPNRGVITIPNNQLWQDLIQHIDIPGQSFYSFIEIMVGDLNVWDPNFYQLKANQVLTQNGTYEVYDEDPDQENGIEILPEDNRSIKKSNKIIKFKATRDGNEDENEDENEEEEEPSETKSNYLGKFTVNVPRSPASLLNYVFNFNAKPGESGAVVKDITDYNQEHGTVYEGYNPFIVNYVIDPFIVNKYTPFNNNNMSFKFKLFDVINLENHMAEVDIINTSYSRLILIFETNDEYIITGKESTSTLTHRFTLTNDVINCYYSADTYNSSIAFKNYNSETNETTTYMKSSITMLRGNNLNDYINTDCLLRLSKNMFRLTLPTNP